jgi:Reverse transcriptase (RNA-dependent DNA polymerase).
MTGSISTCSNLRWKRLKIPESFIKLISNLFLGRKNSVFTAVGNTSPYDVLVGIDQGEIISPLLWCIYYDPLLVEIQSRNLGYSITGTKQNHVLRTRTT